MNQDMLVKRLRQALKTKRDRLNARAKWVVIPWLLSWVGVAVTYAYDPPWWGFTLRIVFNTLLGIQVFGISAVVFELQNMIDATMEGE